MAAILSAILVIGCPKKPIFELELEVDKSNSNMEFERNPIKNDLVIVTMDRRTDRQTAGQSEKNRANKALPTFFGRALIKYEPTQLDKPLQVIPLRLPKLEIPS